MKLDIRHLLVDPHNSVNMGQAIPIFEFTNNGDAADLQWKVTPAVPGNGYEYHAGLFKDQIFPAGGGGGARRITFTEVMALAKVTPEVNTAVVSYPVAATVHGNPPNATPAVFVFVVTRYITAAATHQVIASCTIMIRKT